MSKLDRVHAYVNPESKRDLELYLIHLKRAGLVTSVGFVIEMMLEYLAPENNPDFTEFVLQKNKERKLQNTQTESIT